MTSRFFVSFDQCCDVTAALVVRVLNVWVREEAACPRRRWPPSVRIQVKRAVQPERTSGQQLHRRLHTDEELSER